MNKQITEEILIQVMERLDKGAAVPEILLLFPEQKDELEKVLLDAQKLTALKQAYQPSRELAQKIVNDFSTQASFVTKKETERLYKQEGFQGRLSFKKLLNQFQNLMVNWKLWIPVGAAVVLLVAFGIYQFQILPGIQLANQPASSETPLLNNEIQSTQIAQISVSPIPATGDIDNAVAAILSYSDAEQNILDNAVNDSLYLTYDNQAINDFGQSYEAQF